MRTPRLSALSLAIALSLGAASAQAALGRVGPTDPIHGFPKWYQDYTGLALKLCAPKTDADLAAGNCMLLPGDVPGGDAMPEQFPDHFADEHFWWLGENVGTLANGSRVLLVMALEAAFAGGEVLSGDQMSFARVRVRIDVLPQSGDYRVIYPYGVLDYPNQVAGDRLFATSDIGVACAQGDFSCALKGAIGPFLRPSLQPGGEPLPFIPLPGAEDELHIADPAAANFVTGSPTGTNYFEVQFRPSGSSGEFQTLYRSDEFTLMGRVHTDPIPSEIASDRITYSRSASGETTIDVFARAEPPIGGVQPELSVEEAGPLGTHSGVNPRTLTRDGKRYYGQTTPQTAGTKPSVVYLKDNANLPPTYAEVAVTDQLTVSEALYTTGDKQLLVRASTSDRLAPPPINLILPDGTPTACAQEAGKPAGDVLCQAGPIEVPPPFVTVNSAYNGSATQAVVITGALPLPSAKVDDDDFKVDEDSADNALDCGLGDSDYSAGTFQVVQQPVHGSLGGFSSNGVLTYTPHPDYHGDDSFTYTVTGQDGSVSNIARVSITVEPKNDAPVANLDTGGGVAGVPAIINVLANDTDKDGNGDINPATVLTGPVFGPDPAATAVANGDGTVSFTAAAAGSYSFTYTVSDSQAVSNAATVILDVVGQEIFTGTTALYRGGNTRRWVVQGNTNVHAGQTVVIARANGSAAGEVLGTAVVDAGGNFAWDEPGSSKLPGDTTQVTVTSTYASTTLPLVVRAR